MFLLLCICSSLLLGPLSSADQGLPPDVCPRVPLGRIRSILDLTKVTNGRDAARRSITIALLQLSQHEVAKEISLQLNEEITRSLLKTSIPDNELALYIHGLLATGSDPRSFKGVNLVHKLRQRVDAARSAHPFLLLALCNTNESQPSDLGKTKRILQTSTIDQKALALQVFSCVNSWTGLGLVQYGELMEEAAKSLAKSLDEQISLDVYTTSLIVQALTAYGKVSWNKEKSLDFLEKESETEMDIAKAHYVEMALNAERVRFIKDLYKGPLRTSVIEHAKNISVKLTIKEDGLMDISVILQLTEGVSFLETMERASQISSRFSFAYAMDAYRNPRIYSIGSIANDPEMGTYWQICRRKPTPKRQGAAGISENGAWQPRISLCSVECDKPLIPEESFRSGPMDAKIEGTTESPPSDGEHIMFIYSSSNAPCPAEDGDTDS